MQSPRAIVQRSVLLAGPAGTDVDVRRWSRVGSGHDVWPDATHTAMEIAWVEHGVAQFEVEGQTHRVGPGALMVVPWGIAHGTAFVGSTRGGAVGISRRFVRDGVDRIPNLGHGMMVHARTRRAAALLGACRRLASHGSQSAGPHWVETLADTTVLEICGPVCREAPERPCDRRIARAVERIHAEYPRPLTVAALARDAALSRFHFSRMFRQAVGECPRSYLLRVRLHHAARRLTRSDEAVARIAHEVGICDPSRFGRLFRNAFGMSPVAYRRAR